MKITSICKDCEWWGDKYITGKFRQCFCPSIETDVEDEKNLADNILAFSYHICGLETSAGFACICFKEKGERD